MIVGHGSVVLCDINQEREIWRLEKGGVKQEHTVTSLFRPVESRVAVSLEMGRH